MAKEGFEAWQQHLIDLFETHAHKNASIRLAKIAIHIFSTVKDRFIDEQHGRIFLHPTLENLHVGDASPLVSFLSDLVTSSCHDFHVVTRL